MLIQKIKIGVLLSSILLSISSLTLHAEDLDSQTQTAERTITEQSIHPMETYKIFNFKDNGYTLAVNTSKKMIYNGTAYKPDVVLKYKGDEAVIDSSKYSLSYKNNTNAGTATVTVTGIDDAQNQKVPFVASSLSKNVYIGSISATFIIAPQSITDAVVPDIPTVLYTGKALNPAVTVTKNNKQLVLNKDYKITYENNKYYGQATANIQGINNYTGVIKRNFNIRLKGTALSISAPAYNKIKLKWTKVSGIDSYEIYRSTSPNSGFKKIKTLSKSKKSYTNSSVTFAKTYYYKIRTKKTIKVKVNKKTKKIKSYSDFSPVVSIATYLKGTTLSSASGASKTSIKIKWKKCTGAQGYEIFRSDKQDGTYTLIKSATGTSYTNSSLPINTTWYYKVRAYRKSGGVRIYGAFSTVKSASVNKTSATTTSSSGKVASSTTTNARLKELFPNGVPTKESQMAQYLVNIEVPVKKSDGSSNTIVLRVHKSLATKIQEAFKDMYDIGFPIFGSKDVKNPGPTYAYSWRGMTGSSKLSHHSYGCAIDINPGSNPMIGHTSGKYAPYIDPYSVTPEVVAIWKKYGFYWGGYFNRAKDYMHFSYTGN